MPAAGNSAVHGSVCIVILREADGSVRIVYRCQHRRQTIRETGVTSDRLCRVSQPFKAGTPENLLEAYESNRLLNLP